METTSTPPSCDVVTDTLAPGCADAMPDLEARISAEATFEEAVAALEETVNRAPLHRELFLKLLGFCTTQRTLAQAEEKAASCPEFSSVAQSPYCLIRTLVNAGGLYWLELGEDGLPLTGAFKAGLTAEQIEDATFGYAVITTPVGEQVTENLAPEKRLRRLFDLVPQRAATYLDVLDFCREPHSFKEVESLLKLQPSSSFTSATSSQPLQPSFFIDALERAGGLFWNNGWNTTEKGIALLKELR